MLPAQLRHCHAGLDLLDEPDDLLGGEVTLAHVRPRRLTDFTQLYAVRLSGSRSRKQNRTSHLGRRHVRGVALKVSTMPTTISAMPSQYR